ncbi:ATP-dependent DNA/RNA helicase DHX36 [Coccinella septempunctata]|uniref:ATP-dependent DNA/RNA helicase DHX36 n=1 Tax=Coccinella septempunctata TaxID=41139 RepID=UPI001D062B02|nr:ATP-dependent DNA/RNA helicase DHX36 [Coccinella septempunctata]
MKRYSEKGAPRDCGSSGFGNDDDEYHLELAKQYIIDHGKNPPRPSHLKGRAIGIWHSKMSNLKKSLLQQKSPPNSLRKKEKKKFDSSMGDVSLTRAQKFEIKEVLKYVPDQVDCSSNSYSNIRDSQFKREFLQNINGKLEDHIDSMEVEHQDSNLDQILYDDLKQKHDNQRYSQMLKRRSTLPCYKVKDDIIKLVDSHQVILISGETGCGKTTQVPQFLLDHFIEKKKGSMCKLVCTQPRRISAISVAERVAEERAEALGTSSGYQIRLEKICPRNRGSITFCTTGVVLRQMQADPCLSEYTHIIIDEIHERDIQSDFLITLLKQVMTRRKDLRIVLMSATLNAESFSRYFNDCPHLNIPGFTYPVEEYFLEDVLLRTKYRFEDASRFKPKKGELPNLNKFYSFIDQHIRQLKERKEYNRDVYSQLRNPNSEKLDLTLVYELLRYICVKEDDQGAVLIFLPGFSEISDLHKMIETSGKFPKNRFLVIPLHSQMPTVQQREVFNAPPKGVRKIIISTNIAETSITIDDVVFVIDCGRMKVKSYDKTTNTETLETMYVSKANASQRKGRAGRVRPGVCFHLISRARYETLETYMLPEILRIRLENVILTAKILQLGKIEDFFSKLMDSPDPNVVTTSLNLLKRLEALDDNESLTPLGYHLAKLPLTPQIGKMLLFGALFNCLEPILNIAVVLDYRDPFVLPLGKEKIADKKRKEFANGCQSDHLFMDKLISTFESLSASERKKFCWEYFLSWSTMTQLVKLKKDFMENLRQLSFVPSAKPNCRECNCNSENVDLIRAVVCAGLYPNIAITSSKGKRRPFSILRLINNRKVDFHPKSVLANEHVNSPLIIYYNLVKSSNMYIHDATPVDPFHIIFFGDNFEQITENGQQFIEINSLKFRCKNTTANVIRALKDKLNNFLEYQISHPNVVDLRGEDEKTQLFRTIIKVLTGEEMKDCQLDEGDGQEIDLDAEETL